MKKEPKKISNYQCSKCSGASYDVGQLRIAGGFWSKIFNIQSKRFTTITCSQCKYTELYKEASSGTLENIFDFFTN